MSKDDGDVKLLRYLSAAERYHLARHNIGVPPVLSMFAEAIGGEETVQSFYSLLRERVQHLLASCPLLSCHVHETRSLRPRFAMRKQLVDVDEVLKQIEQVDSPDELAFQALGERMERWAMANFPLTQAPLWRVRLLQHRGSAKFVVVLQLHHMIVDGKGMLNLFQLLVLRSDAPFPTTKQLQGTMTLTQKEGLPPSSDETMGGGAVSRWWIAMAVGKAVVLPSLPLPSFIRTRLGLLPMWPSAQHIRAKAIERDSRWRHIEISSRDSDCRTESTTGVLSQLKATALEHGVKTIHPIIHTAVAIATYKLIRSMKQDTEPWSIAIQSAANERKPELFGLVAGNYVASSKFVLTLSENINLWQMTREYAEALTSPATKLARSRTWSLMPDFLGPFGERLRTPTPELPTTYEAFFFGQAQSPNPYDYAVGISNLGLLANMDEHFQRAAWLQITKPIGNAFGVDVMGWRSADGHDGVSLFVGTRQGVICNEEEEAFFVDALRQSIVCFATHRIDSDATMDSVLQML